MKRVLIFLLIITALVPVEGARNMTQTTVYLQERPIIIKFINMGVDAYWGAHILENAAAALPILEDLIGVPLPSEVKSVEIYGRKTLEVEEWAVGYNDGNLVALEKDHPNPVIVFHELVHFWTIYYKVPWPLVEGYCNLYADLCATELGLFEITYQNKDWRTEYTQLQENNSKKVLNSFNYMSPDVSEESRDYFYLASTVIMYNFYETVGIDDLQEINQLMAAYPMDDTLGGIGIIQYIKLTKEATGITYAPLFMPAIMTAWTETDEILFEESVGRYCAVQELIGVSDSDEQLRTGLIALVNGKFSDFRAIEQAMVTQYYTELEKEETGLPEQEIIYPEKKTGILQNRLFIVGVIMLVVVVILLIIILTKIVGEEEEILEWEKKGVAPQEFWKSGVSEQQLIPEIDVGAQIKESEGIGDVGDLSDLSDLRSISELDVLGTITGKSQRDMKDMERMEDLEDLEELPEIPDIEELTK
jgi:hypothetical protein